MTTQELAYEVISRLKKEYPDADCTLDYDDAWKLLVSVRLAAQCTDARVNVVVQDLYAKYPDVAALAAAEPEAIEAIVRPCGLGKSKARDISACMRILHEQYHDKVPEDFNALLKLPGVGRKSANLIMGDVFGYSFFRRSITSLASSFFLMVSLTSVLSYYKIYSLKHIYFKRYSCLFSGITSFSAGTKLVIPDILS